jgi:hypothetical protein
VNPLETILKDPTNVEMILGTISLVLGVILVIYYFYAKSLETEIWAVTEYNLTDLRRMCSGDFDAVVAVEGNVSCDQPLTAPSSKYPCIWHHTRVDTEHRNSKGQSYWQKGYEVTVSVPFKLSDEKNWVTVDPTDSDIDRVEAVNEITEFRDDWFGGMIPASETGRYRVVEEVFRPEGRAYILGQATCVGAGPEPEATIHYPKHGYINPKRKFFIISRKTRDELEAESVSNVKICLVVAVFAFVVTAFCGLMLLHVF